MEQANKARGCNVSGRIHVNKVWEYPSVGLVGRFRQSSRNLYELIPYLHDEKDAMIYNPSFGVRKWAFFSLIFGLSGIEEKFRRWLLESRSGQHMSDRMGFADNLLDVVVARVCVFLIVSVFLSSE